MSERSQFRLLAERRFGPFFGVQFLGAMNDRTPRTLQLPLDFLDAGKRYRAEIYRDGAGADWHGEARFRFVREEKTVARGDVLSLWLAGGGGAAVRLVPLEDARAAR